ncbi:MAG: hypothetical protein N2255_01670, partial [Kiritimatiellae bacterium]|nr:hypothetical protein [Kiritimatiellia bacterium]
MSIVLPLLRGTVVNLVLLLGFVSLLTLVMQRFARPSPGALVWWQGILHGVMAVLVMLVPVETSPGVIFDCRGAVVGSGALLGGPLVALISLPFPVLYRICLGGTGVRPGIIELLLPA